MSRTHPDPDSERIITSSDVINCLHNDIARLEAENKALRESVVANIEFGMSGENMHFKIGNQIFRLLYEPEDQEDFAFMKSMLIAAFSTLTHDVKAADIASASDAEGCNAR